VRDEPFQLCLTRSEWSERSVHTYWRVSRDNERATIEPGNHGADHFCADAACQHNVGTARCEQLREDPRQSSKARIVERSAPGSGGLDLVEETPPAVKRKDKRFYAIFWKPRH
jgi:hypothetical protein